MAKLANVTNLYSNSRYIVDNVTPTTPYQTIQSAIDAANAAGGTNIVYIRAGSYSEALTLYNGIHLAGSENDIVTINGQHTPPASGAISFRCQLSLRMLHDCSTSLQLLSTYVSLWNSYAAAALRLHEVLQGYTDMLQDLYQEKWMGDSGPSVSVVRMMVLAWRRKVFAPLEPELSDSLLELLRLQRTAVLLQVQSPPPRSCRRCLLEDPECLLLQRY